MFGSGRKVEYAHESGKHCKCSQGREVPKARWGKMGGISTGEVQQGKKGMELCFTLLNRWPATLTAFVSSTC